MTEKQRYAGYAIDHIGRALPRLTSPLTPYLAKVELLKAIDWLDRIEEIQTRERADHDKAAAAAVAPVAAE